MREKRKKKRGIAKTSDEGREGGRRRVIGGREEECAEKVRGRKLYWKEHAYGLKEPVMKEGVKKRGRMMVGTKRKEGREEECKQDGMDERKY